MRYGAPQYSEDVAVHPENTLSNPINSSVLRLMSRIVVISLLALAGTIER